MKALPLVAPASRNPHVTDWGTCKRLLTKRVQSANRASSQAAYALLHPELPRCHQLCGFSLQLKPSATAHGKPHAERKAAKSMSTFTHEQ